MSEVREVTISHTAAEGTTVDGLDRQDTEAHQAIKAAGFTYRKSPGWFIRGSRDQRPRSQRINQAAEALRALGFDVTVDIDEAARPVSEREEHRAEQSTSRTEALTDRAVRKGEEATTLLDEAHKMADAIPFGQPLMPDHHSYKTDRNYRDKIHRKQGKGFATLAEAREAERKSQAAERNQAHRLSLGATLRRIEKLEAEGRDIQRRLTPCEVSGIKTKAEAEGRTVTCPVCFKEVTATDGAFAVHGAATGEHAEKLQRRADETADDIAYWREHIAALEAAGKKVWGPDDFKKGDRVKTGNGAHNATVIRVNKKSLTVESDLMPGNPQTCHYSKITGKENPT